MINYGSRAHDVVEGPCTPEELGAACERLGTRYVQLALGKSFSFDTGAEAINPGMGGYVRDVLASHGVHVAVLGCYFNMIHPDLAEREKGIRRFEAYLQNARHFGAPIVASETGCVNAKITYTPENFTDEAFERAVQVIRRLVAFGERVNTIVGIEPGINHPIYSPERTAQLLELIDSPYLGIVLDPTAYINASNASHQLELTRRAMELFGNRVVAMHLKDWAVTPAGRYEYRNIGEGNMDISAVIHTVLDQRPLLTVITEATQAAALDSVYRMLDTL